MKKKPVAEVRVKVPIKDAHEIDNANRVRIDCDCDSCAETFNVDYEVLRRDGEIEVCCPYCHRRVLVQYVEYATAMVL